MRRWLVFATLAACGPLDGAIGADDEVGTDAGSTSDDGSGVDYDVVVRGPIELRSLPEIVFCEGDLAALAMHVEQVTALLGITPAERYIIEWVDRDEVDRRCSEHAGGCVTGGVGIGTTLSTHLHELNHLITADIDGSLPLWVEGLAVALEPRPIVLHEGTGHDELFHPAEMLAEGHALELSYPTAGHFVRFLWDDLGRDTFVEIAAASRRGALTANLEWFEEVAGRDYYAYADDYMTAHPQTMASLLPQSDPLPWTGDRWLQIRGLDCAAPDTFYDQSDEALVGFDFIEVAEEGRYELTVSRGSVRMIPHAVVDGTIPFAVGEGAGGPPPAEPGLPWVGRLGAGFYRVMATGIGAEPQTVTVDLHPKLGAGGTVPE